MRRDNKQSADRRQKVEVLQFMQEKITRLEDGGKKSTAHNYSSALNSFRRFLCGKIVYADGMDGKLMTAYEHWLQEEKPGGKKLGENSSSFYLRHLRTIWHEMVAAGMVDRGNEDPFKNVFTGVKKTAKRAVPEASITRLEKAVSWLSPNLAFALSMFLFSYYTRGMSFVDLAHLKKTDIQGGVLTYTRSKTGKVLHIELLPEMIMIIRRYAADVKDSPYLFPILNANGEGYESALRLQNKRLNRISLILELNVKLTTHVARHSWATVARDKGVDIETICDALGHSSILVTRIYLAELNSSVINKANRIVLKRKQEPKIKRYESAG